MVYQICAMFMAMDGMNIVIPLDPAQRRAWVLYQLRLRGLTLASLARALGVERHVPGAAFRSPYPKMERALATAIGLQPQQIWPERYTRDGRPNRPMGRPKMSHTKVSDNTRHAAARNGKDAGRA